MVAAADFLRASEVLAQGPPEVQAPVVVGTTSTLLAEGEARLVAMPPRAFFNRAASVAERERRQTADSRRRRTLESLSHERQALDHLRARVEAFLRQSDAAWFAEQAAQEQSLRSQAASQLGAEAELRRRIESYRSNQGALRERVADRADRRRVTNRWRHDVHRFLDDAGDRLDETRAEIADLASEAAATEAARRTAADELPALAEEKRRLEADAVAFEVTKHGLQPGLGGPPPRPADAGPWRGPA